MGMGRTLSAIFNHAIEDGVIASNPAQRPGRYIRTGDRREKIDFVITSYSIHYTKLYETHSKFPEKTQAWYQELRSETGENIIKGLYETIMGAPI